MSRRRKPLHSAPRVTVQRVPPAGAVWPQELADLLGKVPDAKLAKMAGVDRATVTSERHRRGIAPYKPKRPAIDWTADMIALLGTDSDGEVARALGIPRGCVKRKRQHLGIQPFHPPPHDSPQGHFWAPEDLALLGKMADPALAERLGIGVSAVSTKRWRLGIPPYRPKPDLVRWTEEMIEMLGRVPDSELTRRYGISPSAAARKRYQLGIHAMAPRGKVIPTPELVELLALPETEVSRRTGICGQTVRDLREKLGIKLPERWTPEVLARLGGEPDAVIARDLGITPNPVRKRRMALGLPPVKPARRWRAEEIEILETAPDCEVVQRLGRSLRAVYNKRRKMSRARERDAKTNAAPELR